MDLFHVDHAVNLQGKASNLLAFECNAAGKRCQFSTVKRGQDKVPNVSTKREKRFPRRIHNTLPPIMI